MPSQADPDDYRWLVGPEASEELARLSQATQPLHSLAAQLRTRHSAVRTSLLLDQAQLRPKAAAKFSRAGQMFFSSLGLQQSTDQWIAAYKAERYAGCSAVVDICCGIGGDLIALAQVSDATGFDQSEAATALAGANLLAHGLADSRTVRQAASASAVANCDAWHADPNRRVDGRRATRVESYSPDTSTLDQMLDACPHAGFKLAPAANAPDRWQADSELEWISRGGECRQQVAWFGRLGRTPGARRATRIGRDGRVEGALEGSPDQPAPVAEELGRYLFEPDPAVLASHLTGHLAAPFGLARVAPGIGYLTGDTIAASPLLSAFEVMEVLPWRKKRVAALLRSLGVGRLEIKQRGVPFDPERARKELRLLGEHEATLLVFPRQRNATAVIAKRVSGQQSYAPDSLPIGGLT